MEENKLYLVLGIWNLEFLYQTFTTFNQTFRLCVVPG